MDFGRSANHAARARHLRTTTLILLTCLANTAFSQTASVGGIVMDRRTGQPLAGANIVVVGTRLGAAADEFGRYLITGVPTGARTVRASYLGYRTKTTRTQIKAIGALSGKIVDNVTGKPISGIQVSIKGTEFTTTTDDTGGYDFRDLESGSYVIQIKKNGYQPLESMVSVKANEVKFFLKEDIIRGEEIVVTGIASRTAKSVAEVAASRVHAPAFTEKLSYSTTSQLLNGKLAGVQVRQSSGNVGGGFRFDMRSGGGLNGNEQPIIYVDGVRIDNAEIFGFEVGGQGVNLLAELNPEEIENIEVLKGPAGAVSYGTDGSNGVVLVTTRRGAYSADGAKARFNYKITNGWNTQASDYSPGELLSAADANSVLRTGSVLQNTLNASGGSESVRYFAALDSRIEEGILKPNRLDRKNLRANIDFLPNDRLVVSASTSFTLSKMQRPSNDNNVFGYLINTTISPTSYEFVGGGRSAIENIDDDNESNRFVGSLRAEYQPTDFFSTRVSLGLDDHDFEQEQLYPVTETYNEATFDAGLRNHFSRKSRAVTAGFDGRLSISPNRDLNVSLVGGVQLFDRQLETFSTQRYDFLTPLITTLKAGSQQSTIDQTSLHERQAGVFSEANVAIANRYFLSLKLRRDFASRIGRDAASIYYPGASLAWRLDSFRWFPGLLRLFKLRAAYGETGILPSSLDAIDLVFRPESGAYGAGGIAARAGNSKLKPERVRELELGLDAELGGRLAAELTYYKQKANDSIFEIPRAPSTGLPSAPINVGEIEGSGLETLVHASILRTKAIDVSMSFINSWQRNEVRDIGSVQPIFDSFSLNVIKEGLAKHEFYTEPFLGALFNDDGTYYGPDYGDAPLAHGNPLPSYTGSWTLNFQLFGSLRLYALVDWATGHKIWNGSRSQSYLAGNNPAYNLLATQLGIAGTFEADGVAWDVEPVAGVDPFTPGTREYVEAGEAFARMDPFVDSNFIEDADFIKLRELSLGYSLKGILPQTWKRSGLRDITLTLSGQNLFTSTKYSGPEVEVNWSGARDLERGQDYFTLQIPRTYSVTLNVAF